MYQYLSNSQANKITSPDSNLNNVGFPKSPRQYTKVFELKNDYDDYYNNNNMGAELSDVSNFVSIKDSLSHKGILGQQMTQNPHSQTKLKNKVSSSVRLEKETNQKSYNTIVESRQNIGSRDPKGNGISSQAEIDENNAEGDGELPNQSSHGSKNIDSSSQGNLDPRDQSQKYNEKGQGNQNNKNDGHDQQYDHPSQQYNNDDHNINDKQPIKQNQNDKNDN